MNCIPSACKVIEPSPLDQHCACRGTLWTRTPTYLSCLGVLGVGIGPTQDRPRLLRATPTSGFSEDDPSVNVHG